ncbi:hypothetical protein NDU88_009723 [Pleurodeles waltl]|uniref:Uncharacterized protein n=1 Tax=Pleurodeles waltl TaxID=8319 RepID=A0AAV7RZ53_PLEWA|nr:hypothetical protein NDU88_009723 [Pleurodeles waltl]
MDCTSGCASATLRAALQALDPGSRVVARSWARSQKNPRSPAALLKHRLQALTLFRPLRLLWLVLLLSLSSGPSSAKLPSTRTTLRLLFKLLFGPPAPGSQVAAPDNHCWAGRDPRSPAASPRWPTASHLERRL